MVYMVAVWNLTHDERESYSFHINLHDARLCGYREARVIENFTSERTGVQTLCSFLFNLPYGVNIDLDDFSIDSNMWDYHEYTIIDIRTQAAKKIQRRFRIWFGTRNEAATTIQSKFREAIANPYTLICRNRLAKEFKEMNCY